MRRGEIFFASWGLGVAALAFLLATQITGSIAEWKTAITTATLLIAGDVALALWAAGAEERTKRPATWIGVGVGAAAATFLALIAATAPAVFIGVLAGASGMFVITLIVIVLAIVFVFAAVWFALRLIWRRLTPKAGA